MYNQAAPARPEKNLIEELSTAVPFLPLGARREFNKAGWDSPN